ncbi:unnamed protein product [Arctia plantaginis]|uniref:Uncharacterized protein n=1 Tax=Arctia plantaginis TaxID=874455 RepID=A0A8S1B1Z2_ARCPL|nr:unnamed protein product [Arctia plantaginis]
MVNFHDALRSCVWRVWLHTRPDYKRRHQPILGPNQHRHLLLKKTATTAALAAASSHHHIEDGLKNLRLDVTCKAKSVTSLPEQICYTCISSERRDNACTASCHDKSRPGTDLTTTTQVSHSTWPQQRSKVFTISTSIIVLIPAWALHQRLTWWFTYTRATMEIFYQLARCLSQCYTP